jgi:hypothetical protein
VWVWVRDRVREKAAGPDLCICVLILIVNEKVSEGHPSFTTKKPQGTCKEVRKSGSETKTASKNAALHITYHRATQEETR